MRQKDSFSLLIAKKVFFTNYLNGNFEKIQIPSAGEDILLSLQFKMQIKVIVKM